MWLLLRGAGVVLEEVEAVDAGDEVEVLSPVVRCGAVRGFVVVVLCGAVVLCAVLLSPVVGVDSNPLTTPLPVRVGSWGGAITTRPVLLLLSV